ncbi:alcohol dehydrogenase class-3-like [Pungitius pungitius]|uniref:alcohol dehydrogenase class-3-like n=1 Tax=Pungitius pungitius TaxID=134920 RepID=UPI002E0D3D2F
MSTAGQVIRCQAAVAWGPGKPLTIEEVQVAPPKTHEVRIKVIATGVCLADWEYLYAPGTGTKLRPFPLVLGHEAAGVVESVGPGVNGFSPGDKVIPLLQPNCGAREGRRSAESVQRRKDWANTQVGVMADGTSRISCRSQQVYQYLGVASFSQYTVVSDASLAKIKVEVPLDKVCLLGCAVSTGYGAARNVCKVEEGSRCAVFGLGAIGLAAVMGCRAAGAEQIIAVDYNSDMFDNARLFGATYCVNPRDVGRPIQRVLADMTQGGADYAMECVGSPGFMSAALESTAGGWGTCAIAGWTDAVKPMSVSAENILTGRTLKGTYFGDWEGVEGVEELVLKYKNKTLMLDEFITHNLHLDQINKAFDYMDCSKSIRTVIHLWEGEATQTP